MKLQHDTEMEGKNREIEGKKQEVILLKAELERAYRCTLRSVLVSRQYLSAPGCVVSSAPPLAPCADGVQLLLSSSVKATGGTS